MSVDLPQQDSGGGVVRPGVVVGHVDAWRDLRNQKRGRGRVWGLLPGAYLMAWEGVEIPVEVEVRDGVLVAVPPSGWAFSVTACPRAVWRKRS